MEFTLGQIVRFKAPESEIEKSARYKVIELRGDRVLVEEHTEKTRGIRARNTLLVADLEVVTDDDMKATLETLIATIDDPEFDASNPDCIRDLVQYINIQCRAVVK